MATGRRGSSKWNGFTSTPAPSGQGNAARGGNQGASGTYHPNSFLSPGGTTTIHTAIYMDGQKLTEVATNRTAKPLSRAPAGQNSFDPRMTPMPTGSAVST